MASLRLRSDIWVAAFVRRCQQAGAFAAVLRRGDASAGSVFIEVLHAGGADLYAPAVGEMGRRFERVLGGTSAEVTTRLDNERAFDPDLWVVSVDDRQGRHFLLKDEHV